VFSQPYIYESCYRIFIVNYKCFDTEGKLRISKNQSSKTIALKLNVFQQPLHAEVYLYH